MTYEPLALAEKASEKQKELADLTGQVVDSFMKAKFDACLAAIAKLEEAFGVSKLASLSDEVKADAMVDGELTHHVPQNVWSTR